MKTKAHYKRTAAKLVKFRAEMKQRAKDSSKYKNFEFNSTPIGNVLSLPGILVFV